MTGALAWLALRLAVNRLGRQARRLRNPRYFLALLLGLGWLAFVLLKQRPGRLMFGPPTVWAQVASVVIVFGLVAWAWIAGADGGVLAFSPAEVTFLFPAPIPRRVLVHYKLIRLQVAVLINSAIWTVLVGHHHRGPPHLSSWLRAAGIWTLLTTLSLHRLGATLVRTSLAEHGRFGVRHRVVSILLLGTVVGTLVYGLWDVLPGVVAAAHVGARALSRALAAAADHPVLGVVIWPIRALLRPLGATNPAEWRAAMAPALVILVLHYVWVVRSDTAFEEAAAEASLARARRRTARAAAGALVEHASRIPSEPLFPLHRTGWPPTALLWKNLAGVLRRRRARNAALGMLVGGGWVAFNSFNPGNVFAQVVGAFAITWLGFAFLLGPQWIRNDLRGDLVHIDLLRSFPLPGWAIVAVEAAASTITLTLVELALAVTAYLAFLGDTSLGIAPRERSLLLGATVALVFPINYMAMLIQNGAAVFYPGWARIGAAPTGVEALGQQLLTTTAFTVLLGLTLAVPVFAGTLTFELIRLAVGDSARVWALAPALVVSLGLLAGEAVWLVSRVGRGLERLEPSALSGS